MMPEHRHRFVLVADDDRDTRELYRACFDTSGYRTAEAETGSQALVSALEILPDVLLTDYVLPDVDGVTLARRLKADARTAAIRILLVTGYATPDLGERATAAGIERVLLKPCLPHAVLREVKTALGRPATPPLHAGPKMTPARAPALDRREPNARGSAATRIRDEFASLPGLALTSEQARLLFDLDRDTTERILNGLVVEGFLSRTPQGGFTRPRT